MSRDMTRDIASITQTPWVKEFLAGVYLARLATCNPKTLQPHVVPVWYEWDDPSIWISSFRSTRKVREILLNPKVSLVIDTPAAQEASHAVIFEGEAELISDPELSYSRGLSIYIRYLGDDGAFSPEPQSWLRDPEHLLIKLTPSRVYAW